VAVTDVREALISDAGYTPGSLNADAGGPRGVEVGDLIGADDPDLDLVDDRAGVERLI
jgi:RNA polymerase sigma-B factor